MISEFTIKVQIGLTPELAAILNGYLHQTAAKEPVQVTEAAKPEKPQPTETPEQPAASEKQDTREDAVPVAEEQPVVDATDTAAEPQLAFEEQQPAADQEQEYTEVDVRAAMDETRKRIEGEDYKTNTEGEQRTKWHRQLTAWFKNTAAVYGAEKPSELPHSKAREGFIKACKEVYVEDGKLLEPLPF